MQVTRPLLSNATDCRIAANSSTLADDAACHGHGVCQQATGWCDCTIGYNVLTACATPFFDKLSESVRYGAVALALVCYVGAGFLFIVEILHHYLARGVRKTLHPKNFPGWVSHSALLFFAIRISAFALLVVDFASQSARLEAVISIVNTLGLTMLSCVFVLSTTGWLNMIETAKGLGEVSDDFRRCKIANLIIMGVFDTIGALCSILSATGVVPNSFATIAQLSGTIGTAVPLFITIGCLIRLYPFLKKLKESKGSYGSSTRVTMLLTKTIWMVIIIGALIVVFACTFGMLAVDAAMPDVIMFKYYMMPVTDMLLMLCLFYFAQQYMHGPTAPFFGTFFNFSLDVQRGSSFSTSNPSSDRRDNATKSTEKPSTQPSSGSTDSVFKVHSTSNSNSSSSDGSAEGVITIDDTKS